ncbi:MAG: DUF3800 domain-containing protein [Phreatobacter sp.]
MGESNRPLFAYVDETGNTGHNIFDEKQPDFFTAALITKGDFDLIYSESVLRLASRFNEEALHAKDLGFGRLEQIAPDLLRIVRGARASFFVSRVEKKYLLATKMFDSLFDSGENAAVGWHHYNFRALRLMLCMKLSALIDEDNARRFWDCILEKKEAVVTEKLIEVCRSLIGNIENVPDARSREILSSGLEWAIAHPEAIHIHTDRKIAKQGHFPNLVGFANLMDGLDKHSVRLKVPVEKIRHDQQSEFQRTLKIWHEMFSTASPENLRWAGEYIKFQKVAGSTFDVVEDSKSSGIQIADVVLWLYSQFRKEREIPEGCMSLLAYVFDNGWESDFSFAGVEREYMRRFGPMLFGPTSAEQLEAGRKLMVSMEEARVKSMAQYERDKLPPFMRRSQAELPVAE